MPSDTARPLRRTLNPWIEQHLRRLGPDGTVIDLGCGRGYWLDHMQAEGLDPIGVEYRHDRAREYAGTSPIAVGDAARLPLRDRSARLVWCIHVLHHLPGPSAALAEARRVLHPDGHLILAETVEDHPLIRIGRSVRPRWDGVPVHARFSRSSLERSVADAGFRIVAVRQHSIVSWAAWALSHGAEASWRGLTRLERHLPRLPGALGRHVEIVATPRSGSPSPSPVPATSRARPPT